MPILGSGGCYHHRFYCYLESLINGFSFHGMYSAPKSVCTVTAADRRGSSERSEIDFPLSNYWSCLTSAALGSVLTLFSTAVATSCSYFLGSKKGTCSSGRGGTPLRLNRSGSRIASDIICWISRLSFKWLTPGHSWSHSGRSVNEKGNSLSFKIDDWRLLGEFI